MVPSIARQSVIIKCNTQKSILTGNYEFYYAAGLVSKLTGTEISDEIKPLELQAFLEGKLPTLSGKDEKESYLLTMLADYRPSEEYDEQMKEMFLMGKEENRLWIM